jgi:hypothetical protein
MDDFLHEEIKVQPLVNLNHGVLPWNFFNLLSPTNEQSLRDQTFSIRRLFLLVFT